MEHDVKDEVQKRIWPGVILDTWALTDVPNLDKTDKYLFYLHFGIDLS